MTNLIHRQQPDAPLLHVVDGKQVVPGHYNLVQRFGLFLAEPFTGAWRHRDLIVGLTARHRLPAVYPFRLFVAAGGLMAYGTDQADVQRLGASYLDRILRGASPAELPVQAPTKYETLLNLKTAKALGFEVPGSLLVRADEVVE